MRRDATMIGGIVAMILTACPGCWAFGRTRVTPATASVERILEWEVSQPHGRAELRPIGTVRLIERAHGTSPAIWASTENFQLKDIKPPHVKLPSGGAASGGGFDVSLADISTGGRLLILIGGLAVAGGLVILIWLKRGKLGFALMIGGGAMVGVGVLVTVYPWVILVALGLLVLFGAWLIYDAWRGGRLWLALKTVTNGVEKTAPAVQAVVKQSIEDHGGEEVRETIRKAKPPKTNASE